VPDRGERSLFVDRVRDLCRPAVTCSRSTVVADMAARMGRRTSMVVLGDEGGCLGIVTDRDLRAKVVAARRDAGTTTAADIMSSPLVTVAADTLAFEALLEMTRREIHHLVVVEDGRLLGVLASDDLVILQRAHPVRLRSDIARADSQEDLARLAGDVIGLVQRLVDDGGRATDVARIVAELNDGIAARTIALVEAALARAGEVSPGVPYCWMVFGSEARREQTLRTDQDNGLVYADPPPEVADRAGRYFTRLAREAIAGLVGAGFPPCPAGVMASNPQWCQPLATWRQYFLDWMQGSRPEDVLSASIYFDVRPVTGAVDLAAALRSVLRAEAPLRRRFLGTLARDVVERRLPLRLFGGIAVPRSGPHRGTVDLKGAGSMQLVGAARVHALELGLVETNTAERFRAAAARGLYSLETASEIADAFEHLVRLRLVHQLAAVRAGRAPDNRVDPGRLSRKDGVLLRDAFRTVARVQGALRERFATDFVV
jgi:CBS domain-containing protein